MATIIHFLDVGQGNMVLIETANGKNFVFDCNVTDDNQDRVLNYVAEQIGEGASLSAFICSHRDSDHMRGVKKLHARFPVSQVWDSDYPGTVLSHKQGRVWVWTEPCRMIGFHNKANDGKEIQTHGAQWYRTRAVPQVGVET